MIRKLQAVLRRIALLLAVLPIGFYAISHGESASESRAALIIGNSHYQQLGSLRNADTDAKAVAEVFRGLGYNTRLVTDATEQVLSRELRRFAADTASADIGLVFYAGHGAQAAGANYLLPTDMEVPRFESDIALEGIKVDDLINSMRSRTKVLFLDACRDNPVLFKNMASGRGAPTVGLAPANTSSFAVTGIGGGIFIAYAAAAGSLASEGSGSHSPFTEALLRNLNKRISIDDLFSLVTRDVRLVTNGSQRPYKYASLESIVCLSGECADSLPPTAVDAVQDAKSSEGEDLKVALEAKNPKALKVYLDKYSDSPRRDEAVNALSSLRRSRFNEWTLYEMSRPTGLPSFVRLNSIELYGSSVAVQIKEPIDPNERAQFSDSPLREVPEGAVRENFEVIDCIQPIWGVSESKILNKSGDLLWRYKWADPKLLELTEKIEPGTVAATLRAIACHNEMRTPLIDKDELTAGASVASTASGDGEIFYIRYVPLEIGERAAKQQDWQQEAVVVIRYYQDKRISDSSDLLNKLPGGGPLYYRTSAALELFRCASSQMSTAKFEAYDASGQLVKILVPDPLTWVDIQPQRPPASVLQRMICSPGNKSNESKENKSK